MYPPRVWGLYKKERHFDLGLPPRYEGRRPPLFRHIRGGYMSPPYFVYPPLLIEGDSGY